MTDFTPVAVIVGAGPGNGAAFARKFRDEGYHVAVLSRRQEAMDQLAQELQKSKTDTLVRGYSCDVTSDDAVKGAFQAVQKDLGNVSTVVYNAGSGGFKPIQDWTATEIAQAADINAAGLYRVAQASYPQLLLNKHRNILVIGAGAATRGRPNTVGFAAGKAAQRSVAQSLARAWGAEKIHVSYMVIDGIIDTPVTRQWMPDKPDDFFLQSDDLANIVFNVTKQSPSSWTFEFDVRPYGETW